MKRKHRSLSTVTIALFIISSFSYGQITKNDIVLGKRISIESNILNEERDLYIYLPEGYGQSDVSYPVFYILDARDNFTIAAAMTNYLVRSRKVPQMIVVGIPNVARNRDFTPLLKDNPQTSGGANNFINFLENEVFTFIDTTFRTHEYKVLFGHSLCGMFSIYSMFNNPNLFDAYIAVSPYLQYEDGYIVENAKNISKEKLTLNNQLYMTIGNEPEYFKNLDKLSSILKSRKKGINWKYKKYMEEDHRSVPILSIVDGLGFIYSDWELPKGIFERGVNAIKEHHQKRIMKYGFSTQITEQRLNTAGYRLLQAEQIQKALEIFQYNVELYPESANVYDSLGDAFDASGNKKRALLNYQKAVSIGESINDPNVPAYKNNVNRLEKF